MARRIYFRVLIEAFEDTASSKLCHARWMKSVDCELRCTLCDDDVLPRAPFIVVASSIHVSHLRVTLPYQIDYHNQRWNINGDNAHVEKYFVFASLALSPLYLSAAKHTHVYRLRVHYHQCTESACINESYTHTTTDIIVVCNCRVALLPSHSLNDVYALLWWRYRTRGIYATRQKYLMHTLYVDDDGIALTSIPLPIIVHSVADGVKYTNEVTSNKCVSFHANRKHAFYQTKFEIASSASSSI